jgi:hypothetical protein
MFAFNPNNEDEVTNEALATLFLKQQSSSTNQQLDSDDIKVMMNDKIFATYNVVD